MPARSTRRRTAAMREFRCERRTCSRTACTTFWPLPSLSSPRAAAIPSCSSASRNPGKNLSVDPNALRARIEEHVRRHELIEPGGEVCCLVSGGADSTCLRHALRGLGYRVSSLHVNHKLRGADSEADARFCAETLGADVVELDGNGLTEAELREQRYSLARDRTRATGHTASDQVETILYRLVSRGTATGIELRRARRRARGGRRRRRAETEEYCTVEGLECRLDASNADTK